MRTLQIFRQACILNSDSYFDMFSADDGIINAHCKWSRRCQQVQGRTWFLGLFPFTFTNSIREKLIVFLQIISKQVNPDDVNALKFLYCFVTLTKLYKWNCKKNLHGCKLKNKLYTRMYNNVEFNRRNTLLYVVWRACMCIAVHTRIYIGVEFLFCTWLVYSYTLCTQQNSYSISHPVGTVNTRWLGSDSLVSLITTTSSMVISHCTVSS